MSRPTPHLISDNQATGTGSQGGGIANQSLSGTAVATLTSTQVAYNSSDAAPGGIYNNLGTVTLVDSLVAENTPTNCSGSSPSVSSPKYVR